jgi:hypothetical protein
MAHEGQIYALPILALRDNQNVTVAGTVQDSTFAYVARRVIGYRNEDETVEAFTTTSNGSGVIATTTNGNHNDRWRVIVVGIAGENSQIREACKDL